MCRRILMSITVLTAGLLLMGGVQVAPAVAAVPGDGQAELVDRLYSDGLTRVEMVSLYESLVQGEFEPPACTPGDEMFTDVPASHLFCSWIEELARRGITGGCDDGTAYCPGDSVSRAQMAAFILRATADEPPRLVGETGEPEFGNGGEGDCLWGNATVLVPEIGPVSFYKDSDGIVRLAGVARAVDGGPGPGDDVCGSPPSPPPGESDFLDTIVFELPAGYQPEHILIFPNSLSTSGGLIVVPEGGVIIEGFPFPAGAVLAAGVDDGTAAPFDGITFRAATEAEETLGLASEPSSISWEALRGLLFD